jgi:hypothetical protein
MFGFGKKRRKVSGKSIGYSVKETPKGGTRGRIVHIFGHGSSASKAEATKIANAMRQTSGDKYNYRVIRAR